MKTLSGNKMLLSGIIFIILALFAYNFFVGTELSPVEDASSLNVGQDLIAIKAELEQVTLDRNIFSDEKFSSLLDFSAEIPSQSVGRRNPFDTIGRN